MKTPQWITVVFAIVAVAFIYRFARTQPNNKGIVVKSQAESVSGGALTDTILNMARRQISPQQLVRLNMLENSVSRGDVKEQKIKIYHQLAHFWLDSANLFLPYAWYEGEAARLENSEKTLTFAARSFLDNLQQEQSPDFRRWEALQAKDLFERSLIINPDNDSAKVGLGGCYLFGNISAMPMEGITKIREVLQKDSTNVYAHLMLVKGSLMTGQYNNAIGRLQTVLRVQPDNLEAILLLAEVYERTNDKPNAVKWYRESLHHVKREDIKTEIEKRIAELSK